MLEADPVRAKRATEKENRKVALEFLQSAGPTSGLNRLGIPRIALDPEVTLMHLVLKDASAAADHARLHHIHNQAEHSPSRLEKLHRWCFQNGLFHEALRKSAFNLSDPSLWSHLERTEEVAFYIFSSVLRPAAVQWDLLVLRCSQYPYKLFDLLLHPENIAITLQESIDSPCLLDPVAKAFFEKYNTAEAVGSIEAREVLKLLCLQPVGHTWSTERLHSSHARKSRTRIQTHAINLPQIAMWHQARAAPSWAPAEELG